MGDRHVFLSYCRENRNEVRTLRDDLARFGFDVWWDDELKGGQNWKTELRKAVHESGAVMACFSAEVQKRDSSGMFPELRDAIECYRQMHPGCTFLIPVRLSECNIPDLEIDSTTRLTNIQYIDLFPPDQRQAGLLRLVDSLLNCRLLKKPEIDEDEPETIELKSYRAGSGPDPFDEVITVIVLEGEQRGIEATIHALNGAFNTTMPVHDHKGGIHEIHAPGPVASIQVKTLANRFNLLVHSIDHVPEFVYSQFIYDLRRYMASDAYKRRKKGEEGG